MASSSSASAPSWKYDVFLSFRGEDTRRTFTSFLDQELRRYGITTFIDDQLRRGDQISPTLLQAIEDSRFSIVIFSKNYASSSWCLDELTKILECVDKGKHATFPVFCEVDPSHVRHQTGSYKNAFRRHEEAHKNNMEKVIKWRQALTTASGYSGWDTRDKNHNKVIKEIVSKIYNKVPANPSSSSGIGMDSRIEAVLKLLCIGSHDVRMVGIWGMAGIGKTTLAIAIYQKIRAEFEGYCFLSNVREKSQRENNLQKELLSQILQEENLHMRTFNMGSDSIRKTLHSKQVLIVLDDVNHINQLEALAGCRDWFGSKSRIIITTRDKRLLIEKNVYAIYEVKQLQHGEARMLFCQHAFKVKPPMENIKELCDCFLDYTKGNPLAIRILGCLLFERSKEARDDALEKLKKFPNKEVQDVLRISFDGLEDNEKNIFLDIACFFKEEDKDYVSKLLKCSGFYPEIGIPTLVERALITISDDNRLCMHDLIQEMGREIVRQESTEFPGERSRLWLNKDVKDMLETNSGTKTIQGIVLDLSASKELLDFDVHVFTKMINLRVLRFHGMRKRSQVHKMGLKGNFNFLSKNLRYLRWEGYPLKSLPSNFDPSELFELNMSFSWLEQLWEGCKLFSNLRCLDLGHSRHLIKTPDLSRAPELKKINLEGCTSLVEVDSSIETLEKLSFLNLKDCSKLEKVTKSFHKLTSLDTLNLFGCSKLEELPQLTFVKTLNLSCCSELKNLPVDLGMSLVTLVLYGCSKLELPKCIGELMSLETLDLSYCSQLKKLPGDIRGSLVTLDLTGCSKLEELPKAIAELTSLKILKLSDCSELKKLPDEVGGLERLEKLVADGSGIKEVPHSISLVTRLEELSLGRCKGGSINLDLSFLGGFQHLKRLKLRDCNLQEVGDISSLCLLRYLDLSGNSFISLPNLTPLTQLSELRLECCKSLRGLAQLPSSIETVLAFNCKSLETFSHPPKSYMMSESIELKFDFCNCGRLLKKESLEAILGGIQIVTACCEYRRFGALVRGRSVPEWFNHRCEENSIIVKLPPAFYNLNDVGLGFCAVLGQNLWPCPSDHLWFGYLSISDEVFSMPKRVNHLKFSFPSVVKECGINLLYDPMKIEKWRSGLMGLALHDIWGNEEETDEVWARKREDFGTTSVSPTPTLNFDEPSWTTMIEALHLDHGESLVLFIEVEGYNYDVNVLKTSLEQISNLVAN